MLGLRYYSCNVNVRHLPLSRYRIRSHEISRRLFEPFELLGNGLISLGPYPKLFPQSRKKIAKIIP